MKHLKPSLTRKKASNNAILLLPTFFMLLEFCDNETFIFQSQNIIEFQKLFAYIMSILRENLFFS